MHGPPLTTAEIRPKLEREVAALVRLGARRGLAIDRVAQRRGLRAAVLRTFLAAYATTDAKRDAA
jgi:hypothetical protein